MCLWESSKFFIYIWDRDRGTGLYTHHYGTEYAMAVNQIGLFIF